VLGKLAHVRLARIEKVIGCGLYLCSLPLQLSDTRDVTLAFLQLRAKGLTPLLELHVPLGQFRNLCAEHALNRTAIATHPIVTEIILRRRLELLCSVSHTVRARYSAQPFAPTVSVAARLTTTTTTTTTTAAAARGESRREAGAGAGVCTRA
jgi:hypothetical protein